MEQQLNLSKLRHWDFQYLSYGPVLSDGKRWSLCSGLLIYLEHLLLSKFLKTVAIIPHQESDPQCVIHSLWIPRPQHLYLNHRFQKSGHHDSCTTWFKRLGPESAPYCCELCCQRNSTYQWTKKDMRSKAQVQTAEITTFTANNEKLKKLSENMTVISAQTWMYDI